MEMAVERSKGASRLDSFVVHVASVRLGGVTGTGRADSGTAINGAFLDEAGHTLPCECAPRNSTGTRIRGLPFFLFRMIGLICFDSNIMENRSCPDFGTLLTVQATPPLWGHWQASPARRTGTLMGRRELYRERDSYGSEGTLHGSKGSTCNHARHIKAGIGQTASSVRAASSC